MSARIRKSAQQRKSEIVEMALELAAEVLPENKTIFSLKARHKLVSRDPTVLKSAPVLKKQPIRKRKLPKLIDKLGKKIGNI